MLQGSSIGGHCPYGKWNEISRSCWLYQTVSLLIVFQIYCYYCWFLDDAGVPSMPNSFRFWRNTSHQRSTGAAECNNHHWTPILCIWVYCVNILVEFYWNFKIHLLYTRTVRVLSWSDKMPKVNLIAENCWLSIYINYVYFTTCFTEAIIPATSTDIIHVFHTVHWLLMLLFPHTLSTVICSKY